MDWTQQMEQMTKQWMDAQKVFWNGWAENARRSAAAPTTLMWQQMLAAWQTSVRQMLDAQVEGIRLWTEGVAGSGAPEHVQQWADQLYQMTKQWTSSQKQMWDGWFLVMEKLDPPGSTSVPGMDMQALIKQWQELGQQAMNDQQQWLKTWSAWQPGKKG